jgi:hypothetical protein
MEVYMRFAALLATLVTGCTLLPTEIDGRASAIPDRGVAPWWVETLEVCIDDVCGAEISERVHSADVRWDGERFRVIAEVDGELVTGELTPRWHLDLESTPVLTPSAPWHAGALRDPAWLDDDTVVFGVEDDSVIGYAGLSSGDSTLLWDAIDLGAALLTDPTALRQNGRVTVAAAIDDQAIVMAWGDGLDSLAPPTPILSLSDVEYDGWRDITGLSDPALDLATDGLVALFFVADGRETPDQRGIPAPLNASVGYAGSVDGEVFEVFGANPVHDRAFSFLFHAAETEPSVARDGDVAIMLHRDTTDAGATLGIAVHELD